MPKGQFAGPLEQVDSCCYRIPKSYRADMRVDGLIYANAALIEAIRNDQAPEQVANVATLPGIQGASLAMPDIHWGYGFTIGGVAATDPAEGGVISPGGVGYDINCGVRLIKTNLTADDLKKNRLRTLVQTLFDTVPAGVGKTGAYKYTPKETRQLMAAGPRFVVDRGLGTQADLDHTEALGCIADADPDAVTDHAVQRGAAQCGTLGSGNHFLEIQVVDRVLDEEVARAFGLELDQVCVMIHSGSRGLGYQVCDDALASFRNVPAKYGIVLPDRQLACAPVDSPEGKHYIAAMRAAANYGFCNRQLLTAQARDAFAEVFGRSWQDLGMELLYDVAHNIAKLEDHTVNGVTKPLWVHRKGATRAFPAGHPEVPAAFRAVGQPVLIPGDMGRASWVLVGRPGSMLKTFGTTCHGAGRAMSRTAAVKDAAGRRIDKELEAKGIIAMSSSRNGLAEEQPRAYKNVDDVVEVVDEADLSRRVARMRPVGVIKG
jgi:tRNA-splicing ligase RtcB